MAELHKIPAHLQAVHPVRRETFASLMDLYENNYIRLKKMLPRGELVSGEYVSSVAGCLDLYLSVFETTRFTSQLKLTYLYQREQNAFREPNLELRLYHDVGMVEVLSGELHHGKLVLRNLPETALDERWHLNRFLYKWLGFCLHIGHGFNRPESSNLMNQQLNQILIRKY